MSSMATEISEVGQTVHNHNEQYLTFFLADQEYGVEILKVQGIQGWDEVTSLPNSPDYLLGVINLRGAIVPIVDLRKMFKLRKVDYNSITVVIVVKVNYGLEEKTVGMVVDAVSEVYNINAENMNASPEFGEGVDTQYVMGLATIDEKMIILLDVDHLIGEGVLDVEAEEPEVH